MINRQKSTQRMIFWAIVTLLALVLSACNMGDAARSVSVLGDELERICAQGELVVNTTEDTNDAVCNDTSCSLREAVVQANTCDSAQTIVLTHSAYELTRHGLNEDIARSGDLDITAPVTIRGEGNPIIDGQEAVRIFDVRLEEGGTVVFENLTMQDGWAESRGGALRIMSGDVELKNAVVRNSQAGTTDEPGAGGGIYTKRTLTLVNTEVSGNRVYGEGGGIFGDYGAVIEMDAESALVFNEALDGYSGGGLYSREIANISGQIVSNRSTWAGGGVANAGSMEIREAEIRDNTATEGTGGGISNVNELRVEDSQVISNTAEEGGGLFAYVNRFSDQPRTYLVNTVFQENEASRDGGAIFNSDRNLLVGTNLQVANNHGRDGAGIANYGEAYLLGSTVRENVGGREGAGILVAGDMSVSSSTFVGNRIVGVTDDEGSSVEAGTAISVDREGFLNLLNTTLSGNGHHDSFGAVILTSGRMIARHVTIADNATSVFGGATETFINVNLSESLVVRNGDASVLDCAAQISSSGFNIFDDSTCSDHADDYVLSGGEDPAVGPLADNGGGTMTHALLEGSPAIDGVEEGCPGPDVDQRGEPRPAGEACDIGAFEGELERETRSGEIDVNFNADRYTIERNECTTLRWQVSGASSILLLGQEREPVEAQEVCPDDTTGYTLFASNETSEEQVYLEIEVTEPTDDGGPAQGCFVNGNCTVPCPGDPQQYGGVCYQ